MKELIKNLSTPEQSGKKIGFFRTICAIFGGLLVAYLGMSLLIYIIPGSAAESIVVPLLFNTFFWATIALWISLSSSKLIALLRVLIPTLIFTILLIILYNF